MVPNRVKNGSADLAHWDGDKPMKGYLKNSLHTE